MADQNGANGSETAPVAIKKYANRRLYNTATSSYVTLDGLSQMVKDGTDFVVTDAKTGEDITRAVLTQIIVEEEAKGQNLLPISFLRQLIGFYGDSMQWAVPAWLDFSMQSLTQNQDRMRETMTSAFGGIFPFSALSEMGRQNMALFENAMGMFRPGEGVTPRPAPVAGAAPPPDLDALNRRLDELQAQLRAVTQPPSGE